MALAASPPRLLAAAKKDDPEGNKLMAENIAFLAQIAVGQRTITPETLRQSIALLKAARMLNPDEPRFARLLAEAALQAGEIETAIEAYAAVNRIDPDDRIARIRLIDLYVGRMQSADAQLKYLVLGWEADEEKGIPARKGIYQSEQLPAEVRAHAAYLACEIYLERSEESEAMRMLEESLRLFPLSPEALKLKYKLVGDSVNPPQRVALLLTMLRSNPAQPGVMAKLASELADVGLMEEALTWYAHAFEVVQRIGRGITNEDMANWAALMLIANQSGAADMWAGRLLQNDPTDVDAAFLALIVARASGDADKREKAGSDAEQALIARAQFIHHQLEGGDPNDPAATQPSGEVNVSADVKKLLEIGDPQLTAAYASTLADLAWKRIYFDQKPAEAEPVISSLRQLLPPDSVTLARLEGWSYLTSAQPQEARSKLSAVADRDPLAALGMIRLMEQDPATKDRVIDEARRLMDQNTSRTLGAIIHDALRDKKPRYAPGQKPPLSELGAEVKRELDAFPKDWIEFLQKPSQFYLLRAEPMKVSHHYREPIIARVTVRNMGDHDITVGPDGAIRPDLWFDVILRGVVQQALQGVAYDRLTQHVVLRPKDQIVMYTRIDQGQLYALLSRDAQTSMPLLFSVFNNPITLPASIAPAPGGQRASFTRPISRTGFVVSPENIQKVIGDLGNGTPQAKMRAAEMMMWLAEFFRSMDDQQAKAQASALLSMVHKAGNDSSANVRAWASFSLTNILDAKSREKVLEEMLRDESWQARLLALVVVAQTSAPGQWKTICAPLAQSDPEPLIRDFAAATVAFADHPAATQPATQPSEEEEPASPMAQP